MRMTILVLDVGGTNVKVGLSGSRRVVKIPSGPSMTPAVMCRAVLSATKTWHYDAVTIGYPGAVRDGRPVLEPRNLGAGWRRFDFRAKFGRPVRIINDAAMQALGSYERGGRMLFLGLGTGLGSAIVDTGARVEPLELAHLPYRHPDTYEDFLGTRGLERLGRRKWERHVHAIVELLRHALMCDRVVLGGGNARKLTRLPPHTTRGQNIWAIRGGRRVWNDTKTRARVTSPRGARR